MKKNRSGSVTLDLRRALTTVGRYVRGNFVSEGPARENFVRENFVRAKRVRGNFVQGELGIWEEFTGYAGIFPPHHFNARCTVPDVLLMPEDEYKALVKSLGRK